MPEPAAPTDVRLRIVVDVPREHLSVPFVQAMLCEIADQVGTTIGLDDLMVPADYDSFEEINVVFDGPPGRTTGRFVETEALDGRSVGIGEWIQDGDRWYLRLPVAKSAIRG